MRYLLVFVTTLMLSAGIVLGQESATSSLYTTGYINLGAEYLNDLQLYERQAGVALTEAGILTKYQLNPNLSFKAVIVYRPRLNFNQMINELNAEWTKNEYLRIKVGRFLTPLSPINLNSYAPMNRGIAIPLMIAHHELYPLNIEGVSLHGEFGDRFKMSYDVFGGGYFSLGHVKSGTTGFYGMEDIYIEALENNITSEDFDINEATNYNLYFSCGAHFDVSFNDIAMIGLNGLYGTAQEYHEPFQEDTIISYSGKDETAKQLAIGINFKFNLKNFEFSGERMLGFVQGDEGGEKISGLTLEADYNIGTVTPYLKYESHHFYATSYSRQIAGINVRLSYELMLKGEYVHYAFEESSMNGGSIAVIYSF